MIYCCNCKKEVETEIITGDKAYPDYPFTVDGYFHKCLNCNSFVGCHKGTDKPLGCIPTDEMKNARQHIHKLIDPLWQLKKISRNKLYKLIAKELNIKQYHTAWTRSIEECRDVYRVGLKIRKQLDNKNNDINI